MNDQDSDPKSDDDNRLPEEGEKLYLVALTERYEVKIYAKSRLEAMDKVDRFGGSSPVSTKITARRVW